LFTVGITFSGTD